MAAQAAPAVKRARTELSLETKLCILSDLLACPKQPRAEIAKKYGCSQPTLTRIWQEREALEEQRRTGASLVAKRSRQLEFPLVNSAVTLWFQQMRACGAVVSDELVKTKAAELAVLVKESEFKASNGWLAGWKARNKVSFKHFSGEAMDSDGPAANTWSATVLPGLLGEFDPEDIFNGDETGLYFKTLPKGTLSERAEQIARRKDPKNKNHPAVHCQCNQEYEVCFFYW